MQRNPMKAHIFLKAVIFVLSIGVWLAGCTPNEEVVAVTVRPTIVGQVGTAVVLDPAFTSTSPSLPMVMLSATSPIQSTRTPVAMSILPMPNATHPIK